MRRSSLRPGLSLMSRCRRRRTFSQGWGLRSRNLSLKIGPWVVRVGTKTEGLQGPAGPRTRHDQTALPPVKAQRAQTRVRRLHHPLRHPLLLHPRSMSCRRFRFHANRRHKANGSYLTQRGALPPNIARSVNDANFRIPTVCRGSGGGACSSHRFRQRSGAILVCPRRVCRTRAQRRAPRQVARLCAACRGDPYKSVAAMVHRPRTPGTRTRVGGAR